MEKNKIIRLPAAPSDDLQWDLPALQEPVYWHLDIGPVDLEDEMGFRSHLLAMKTFTDTIWSKYEEQTLGVILYRGSADFSENYRWTDLQKANWKTWLENREITNPDWEDHLRKIFCFESMIHYFQLLAHQLPDETAILLDFETKISKPAERAHLLSKERFEHFDLLTDPNPESTFALCMPEDANCSEAVLSRVNELLEGWDFPVRIVYEAFLTEQWDGLDDLYVLSDTLGPLGKRKLLGFCAAGGRVIVEGNLLGLPQEILAEEMVRGRGI